MKGRDRDRRINLMHHKYKGVELEGKVRGKRESQDGKMKGVE